MFIAPNDFAGYYAELLPERCWDSTGTKVISDENWGSLKVVTCCNVLSKEVTKVIGTKEEPGAWSVLDVCDNIIIAGYSSPTSAPQLVNLVAQLKLCDLYIACKIFCLVCWSSPR